MIANIGIGLDGTMRNIIGRDADMMLKSRIMAWLTAQDLVTEPGATEGEVALKDGYVMSYGSEPDIAFWRDGNMIASIEVKGGRDSAGALERLGAAMKALTARP